MGRFIPRSEWGLPATWPARTVDRSQRTGFVVHWDGGPNPKDAAGERSLLLAYHRYHLSTAGTGGFDYNLAVGPITGDIYEGRGLDTLGAHAGGHNTANIGVILIGGPGNLTEAGKRGLREAYALACQHVGRSLSQRVHSDVNSTSCPGDDIRAWVHGGGLVGANVPASSSTYVGRNDTSRPTADIQRLVGADPDGQYGPDTTAKVRAWQASQGLVADGIWGPISDARGFPAARPALLDVDGVWGPLTTMALQRILGVTVDGIFGPETIRALQRVLGVTVDGIAGPVTKRALQARLRVTADGIWGPVTTRALQSRLNTGAL